MRMTRRDAKSKAEASTTVVTLGYCDDGHLGKTEAREVVFLDDLSRIGKRQGCIPPCKRDCRMP
jgi:hypothetical protein